MKEDLTKLSDTELVKLFLGKNDKKTRQALRDTIFARFYEQFDKTIRAVLRIEGIPYQDNEEYYNTVFTEVYGRVFSLDSLDKKLKSFDLNRDFKPWFFAVTRGEVYGWLKKVDPETGLSNYELLKNIAKTRAKEESLDKPADELGHPEPLEIGCIISEERPFEEEERNEQLRSLIDGLPDSQRVLLRLQFIAYEDLLPPNDIAYIARETNRSTDAVQRDMNQLRTALRESDRFKEYEKKKLLLISLRLKEENLERKIFFGRANLEALGCDDLEEIEGDVQDLTLKYITEAIRAKKGQLRDAFEEKQREVIKSDYIDFEKSRHLKALKQLQITRKKREKILVALKSGKYLVRPDYKQTAAILGIKEGTIGSRKNRAKEALLKRFAGSQKN